MTCIIDKDKNNGYHNIKATTKTNYNNNTATQMIIKTKAESN